MRRIISSLGLIIASLLIIHPADGLAQTAGTIRGTVTLSDNDKPLHNVIVTVVELKRSTETDEAGVFELAGIPPGTYTVLAHLEGFPDTSQRVTVTSGSSATADFELKISGLREEITVTASGSEQTNFRRSVSDAVDTLGLVEERTRHRQVLEKSREWRNVPSAAGSSPPSSRLRRRPRLIRTTVSARLAQFTVGDHGESVGVLQLARLES